MSNECHQKCPILSTLNYISSPIKKTINKTWNRYREFMHCWVDTVSLIKSGTYVFGANGVLVWVFCEYY